MRRVARKGCGTDCFKIFLYSTPGNGVHEYRKYDNRTEKFRANPPLCTAELAQPSTRLDLPKALYGFWTSKPEISRRASRAGNVSFPYVFMVVNLKPPRIPGALRAPETFVSLRFCKLFGPEQSHCLVCGVGRRAQHGLGP